MNEIGRHHPAHQPPRERHNVPVIVFLTACTKDRKPILAVEDVYNVCVQPGLKLERGSLAATS